MPKILVRIQITSRFLGISVLEEMVIGPENEPSRIYGFVREAMSTPLALRGLLGIPSMAKVEGRACMSRFFLNSYTGCEVSVEVSEGSFDHLPSTSAKLFEETVWGMYGHYLDSKWDRASRGWTRQKKTEEASSNPFHISVEAFGEISVRYGTAELKADQEGDMRIAGRTRDEGGVSTGESQTVYHSDLLTRTCDQVCGDSESGYHRVPSGRLFKGRVYPTYKGYDLDAVDEVVALISRDWGPLEVRSNISPVRIYRSSSEM